MKHYYKPEHLQAIALAASTEESRYYLNGVFCSPDGGIAATNGHIMAMLNMKKETPMDKGFIFSNEDIKKALQRVKEERKTRKALAGKVMLALEYAEPKITVSIVVRTEGGPGMLLTGFDTKAVDGRFPDIWRIIPSGFDSVPCMRFNTDSLAAFGKMRRLLTEGKVPDVRLKFSGEFSPALVEMPSDDFAFTGVIMPLRYDL